MTRYFSTDPDVANRILTERGGHLARELGLRPEAIRSSRMKLRRKCGVTALPRWTWTATDDKALITFIRNNQEWTPDYWERAGVIVGGRSGAAARWRWRQFRAQHVPCPPPPGKPAALVDRWQKRRKWTPERIAKAIDIARNQSYQAAADALGVTFHSVRSVVYRNTGGIRKAKMQKFNLPPLADNEEVKTALKTWRQYEAIATHKVKSQWQN